MASESMLRRYVCVSGNCGGLAEGCWLVLRQEFSPSVIAPRYQLPHQVEPENDQPNLAFL